MEKTKDLALVAALIALLLFPCVPGRAQSRIQNSISLFGGVYAASGFGSNPCVGARYNYFLLDGRYFVEASLGFSSLKSKVIESISQAQLFGSNDLYTYEFIAGYDPSPSGYIPYMVGGVAGVNQGGQTTFAGVLGLGKRIPLGAFPGSTPFGLRYDVRDHMFSQQVNNTEPFLAHNITFTLGLQFYF